MNDSIRKKVQKMNNWMSDKKILYLSAIVFFLSMIPILYVSFFDYATGDDLGYGAAAHYVIVTGGSIGDFFRAILNRCVDQYTSWGGTWTSTILWTLEPSIWGEKMYIITPFIALSALCGGTGYLMYEIIVHWMYLDKIRFGIIYLWVCFFLIQYMPTSKAGLFWYAGMVQYTLSFGFVMVVTAWLLRYINTGRKRYLLYMLIPIIYLGGAGYPEAVVITVVFFIILGVNSVMGKRRVRSFYAFIPFGLELMALLFSIVAPGNKVRGGTGFGFHISKVFIVLAECLQNGVSYGIKYFLTVRPLILLILVLILCSYDAKMNSKCKISYKYSYIVLPALFLIYCAAFAPVLYSGENVAAGISGGVYNSYYFVFIICCSLGVLYGVQAIRVHYSKKKNIIYKAFKTNISFRLMSALIIVFFIAVFSKHLTGNMICVNCVRFIQSGQLADFSEQMEERLTILENPSVKNAVVPEMNDRQGPFMHMALLGDPSAYTNTVTAEFYSKQSVIAVSRDEYEKMYK